MKTAELDGFVILKQFDEAGRLYEAEYDRMRHECTSIVQFQWAEHAAKLNIQNAISAVFHAYQTGDGVEPSASKAFAWLQLGASQNGGERFYQDLALAYRDGIGTEIDIDGFWDFMTQAAQTEEGREAMFHLARAHEDPMLGKLSTKKSLYWTRKMALAGAAGAMTKLAQHYMDGDAASDGKIALDWAQKAVAAAQVDVAAAIAAKSDPATKVKQDWAYEDCPNALATLADILLMLGQTESARLKDKEAAEAAERAGTLSLDANEKPSRRLSQVMLRELVHHLPVDGTETANGLTYFSWLSRVATAVERAQGDAEGLVPLSPELSNAVFSLARAFKVGIGVAKDDTSYLSWLQKAADWGSSDAAFEYAMRYRVSEHTRFLKYISKACEARDNMLAYIAKVVDECAVDAEMFTELSSMLTRILNVTDQVRQSKHLVNSADGNSGIAHYTKAEALKNMLGNQTKQARNLIRLYNIAYVNDPNEGKRLTGYKSTDSSYVNPLASFYETRADGDDATASKWQDFSVFLASFSLESNNLNLWRFYGDDGTGFSVVTPLNAFNTTLTRGAMGGAWADRDDPSSTWSEHNVSPSTVTLNKVLYKDSDVKEALELLAPSLHDLNEKLKTIGNSDIANPMRSTTVMILSELMYLYKERDYEDEREVRVVEARLLGASDLKQHAGDSTSFSKLYVETAAVLFKSKGSAIIIGPKVQKASAVMLDIRHQLATMEWNHCEVRHSLRPYR